MWNENARRHTVDSWRAHSKETGHTNFDSDDDYEIRCRECDYVVHYSSDEHIAALQAEIALLKEKNAYLEGQLERVLGVEE